MSGLPWIHANALNSPTRLAKRRCVDPSRTGAAAWRPTARRFQPACPCRAPGPSPWLQIPQIQILSYLFVDLRRRDAINRQSSCGAAGNGGFATSRDRMTDLCPQAATLAGAITIVRMHGLARRVPLVLAMLLTGFLEGIGIASLFPVLSIVTQGQGHSTRLNQAIE